MIEKFYLMTPRERRLALLKTTAPANVLNALAAPIDNDDILDKCSENVIGAWRMPLGILTGILINGEERPVAMATEEPSVVAAANRAARIFNAAGGVRATANAAFRTSAQIVATLPATFANAACEHIRAAQSRYLAIANDCDPTLVKITGGAFGMDASFVRAPDSDSLAFLAVNLHVHTGDAMGANAVNTMAESLQRAFLHDFSHIPGYAPLMAIVSNDAGGRMVTARITLTGDAIKKSILHDIPQIMHKIQLASIFSKLSPQRAVTHNKGIMNGVIAAATVLGQDTRAIEAAAYHHACQSGRHQPLSIWEYSETAAGPNLTGILEMPLPVGAAGGARHIGAVDAAFRFSHIRDVQDLCATLAGVGLAQNFGALLALVTDGIQKGHMKCHLRKNS